MPLYAVSYVLKKQKDYKKLWDEMDRLGGHKALNSFYFLNVTSKTAQVLRNHLLNFIDDDDQLVVVEFEKRPSTQRANSGTKEWLDKNM